jgi:hypothetical protein
LVKAEKTNPQFIEYGFKPEQLWTMQHQVYGQALTPLAMSVSKQVAQAEQMSHWVQLFILCVAIFSAMLSLILFVLSKYLKNRIVRVRRRITL